MSDESPPQPRQGSVAKRLSTYMLLGQLMREQEHPAEPELRLTSDGWEIRGGEVKEPIPLHVDLAYEASGFDQRVLDTTRELCGELRFKAKKSRVVREQLDDLRAGLRRAAAMKEARS